MWLSNASPRDFLIINYRRNRPLDGRYHSGTPCITHLHKSACTRGRRGENRGVESSCKKLRLSLFLCRTRGIPGGSHTHTHTYTRTHNIHPRAHAWIHVIFGLIGVLAMARVRHGRDNNTGRRRKKKADLPPTWRNREFYLYRVAKLVAFTLLLPSIYYLPHGW